METIVIEVGEDLDSDEMAEALAEDDGNKLFEIARHDISHTGHADRAEINSCGISDVSISEPRPEDGKVFVSVNYWFSWSAYYGCKDANCGDNTDSEFDAEYVDGTLVIEVPEKRTTVDEF